MSLRIICITLLSLLWMTAAAQEACPGSLPPRLAPGTSGRVTPGDPNNVRAEPARSATLIGGMAGGTVFTVLAGPQCADGLSWWQVRYQSKDGAVTGWTVEGAGDTYFLEPLSGNVVQGMGISFILSPEIADSAEITFIEAVLPTEDRPWSDYPAYYEITAFENYADAPGEPNIRIYRTDVFKQKSEEQPDDPYYGSGQWAIEGLVEILAERPNLYTFTTVDNRIPDFAPMTANVLLAQMDYLDFQNGSGYRFITAYAQDFVGVTNTMLLYRYLGLTDDRQYFIEAEFPIDSPRLPPDFDRQAAADDRDNGFAAFQSYSIQSARFFDAIPLEEYTPDLSQLDSLIASLFVAPDE